MNLDNFNKELQKFGFIAKVNNFNVDVLDDVKNNEQVLFNISKTNDLTFKNETFIPSKLMMNGLIPFMQTDYKKRVEHNKYIIILFQYSIKSNDTEKTKYTMLKKTNDKVIPADAFDNDKYNSDFQFSKNEIDKLLEDNNNNINQIKAGITKI